MVVIVYYFCASVSIFQSVFCSSSKGIQCIAISKRVICSLMSSLKHEIDPKNNTMNSIRSTRFGQQNFNLDWIFNLLKCPQNYCHPVNTRLHIAYSIHQRLGAQQQSCHFGWTCEKFMGKWWKRFQTILFRYNIEKQKGEKWDWLNERRGKFFGMFKNPSIYPTMLDYKNWPVSLWK